MFQDYRYNAKTWSVEECLFNFLSLPKNLQQAVATNNTYGMVQWVKELLGMLTSHTESPANEPRLSLIQLPDQHICKAAADDLSTCVLDTPMRDSNGVPGSLHLATVLPILRFFLCLIHSLRLSTEFSICSFVLFPVRPIPWVPTCASRCWYGAF